MTIIQHYYTSVEGKGFQTSEIDGNLDYDLIKEIERRGNYSPPHNLPPNPTDDDLVLFPISYSFYKKDGKHIITHSKYIGKDYTGRYGNYFAHSLIFDTTSDIFNLSPIQFWGAHFWVSKDGRDIQPIPKFNPDLNISGIKNFYWQRKEQISLFVIALHQYLQNKKRIIIVDSAENVAKMVYLSFLFIPTPIFMEKISFTTYSTNPNYTNYSICGTTIDSEFNFSSDDYKEYNIFNFFEEKYPTQLSNSDFSILFRLLNMNNMKNFEGYFNYFLKFSKNIPIKSDLLMIHDIYSATIVKVPKDIKDRVIFYIDEEKFNFDESIKRNFLKKKNYELYEHTFYDDVDKDKNKTKKFIEYSNLMVKNTSSDISKKFIDRAYNKIWGDEILEFEEIMQLLQDKIIYENVGGQCKEKIVDSLIEYHSDYEDKESYSLLKKIKKKPELITQEKLNEIEDCISQYDRRNNQSRRLRLDDSAQSALYQKRESDWGTIHKIIFILLFLIICLEIVVIVGDFMNISPIPEILNSILNF